MLNTTRCLLLLLLLVPLTACYVTNIKEEHRHTLRALHWLLHSQPQDEVRTAIKRKDFRFMSIYEDNRIIPGISADCANQDSDHIIIEGTSTQSIDFEHEKLNLLAEVYARYFNQGMLEYRRNNNLIQDC